MSDFLPVYSSLELEHLLSAWINGSLDSIVARGGSMVGVDGCSKAPFGLRPENLLERFLRDDVTNTITSMGKTVENARLAAVLCIHHILNVPLVDIARALEVHSLSAATDLSTQARNEFMRQLLDKKR